MGNDPGNKIDPTGCYANGGPFLGDNPGRVSGSGRDLDPYEDVDGHIIDPSMGSTGGQEAIQELKNYQASLLQNSNGGSG